MKKLDTTKQLPLESVLRIYKRGYGYAKLTVVATHELFLAAQSPNEFISSVNVGDVLEAYLWVEDIASFEFELEVIGTIPSEPGIIFFRNTENIKKERERKCLGAPTRLPIKYFTFTPGEMHKSFSSEKVVFHEGCIVWLEDREAIIRTDAHINEEVFVKGHIQIDGRDTEIVGRASVLNYDKFIYNILFTGISEIDRNRILDYIFSAYRE
jgi:hypothetical protein